jgi:hypothetical protein
MKVTKFLNTAFGSLLKVVITVVLGHILLELKDGLTINQIFTKENVWSYVTVVFTSAIPIVINWLNPEDTRYGSKEKVKDFDPEVTDIKA